MKKPTYASRKRKLDSVFSEWIRRKDAGAYGRAVCVSCGMTARWQDQQCGHFLPRHYLSGRWNERNCFVQCPGCNVFKRGNYPGFSSFLNRTYGPERIEELLALKRTTVKLYRGDLEKMILELNEKLGAL